MRPRRHRRGRGSGNGRCGLGYQGRCLPFGVGLADVLCLVQPLVQIVIQSVEAGGRRWFLRCVGECGGIGVGRRDPRVASGKPSIHTQIRIRRGRLPAKLIPRLFRLYEGTSEVQRVIIGGALLREAGMPRA